MARRKGLRGLHLHRPNRADGDRPGQEAVQGGVHGRQADFGRCGEPGGLLRAELSRRHNDGSAHPKRRPHLPREEGILWDGGTGAWFGCRILRLRQGADEHRRRRDQEEAEGAGQADQACDVRREPVSVPAPGEGIGRHAYRSRRNGLLRCRPRRWADSWRRIPGPTEGRGGGDDLQHSQDALRPPGRGYRRYHEALGGFEEGSLPRHDQQPPPEQHGREGSHLCRVPAISGGATPGT